MTKLTIAGAIASLLICSHASAQSVSSRVSGTLGGVTGSAAGGAAASAGSAYGAVANPAGGAFDYGSNVGGELPGGMGVRMGDKTVTIKGAVGVGSDSSAFKAGAGIPF